MAEYHYDPQDGKLSKANTELFTTLLTEAAGNDSARRHSSATSRSDCREEILGSFRAPHGTHPNGRRGVTIHTNLNGKMATYNFILEPNISSNTDGR